MYIIKLRQINSAKTNWTDRDLIRLTTRQLNIVGLTIQYSLVGTVDRGSTLRGRALFRRFDLTVVSDQDHEAIQHFHEPDYRLDGHAHRWVLALSRDVDEPQRYEDYHDRQHWATDRLGKVVDLQLNWVYYAPINIVRTLLINLRRDLLRSLNLLSSLVSFVPKTNMQIAEGIIIKERMTCVTIWIGTNSLKVRLAIPLTVSRATSTNKKNTIMQIAAIWSRLIKYFFLGTVLIYAPNQNISTKMCIKTMAQITIPSSSVDPTITQNLLIYVVGFSIHNIKSISIFKIIINIDSNVKCLTKYLILSSVKIAIPRMWSETSLIHSLLTIGDFLYLSISEDC